ncbi:MAG: hypothetical protein ACQEXJ_24280 [Myxococcota bacterium]
MRRLTTLFALVGLLGLSHAAALAAEPATDPPPAAEPQPATEPAPPPGEPARSEPEPTPSVEATAAEDEGGSEFGYEDGGLLGTGLVFGVKLGGGFGQVTSEFDSTFVGELELGYNLPFLERSLGVFTSVAYAGPTTEGTADSDPRLPGEMSYEVHQRQLIWSLGLLYRVPLDIPMFRPYVAAGWRAYFMESVVEGEAGGEPFGENRETSTSWGGAYGALGGELHFGDFGALGLEVQFGWASIDNYVLRDTNAGSLNVALTYRFFL